MNSKITLFSKNKFFRTALLLCFFGPLSGFGQTTLAAGDIAFSGYISVSSSPDDEFSFVLLKNIVTNTEIRFTDFGWRTDTNNFTSGSNMETEGVFKATTNLSAGTEIRIINASATTTAGTSVGTMTYTSGANFLVTTGPGFSFATAGDQIFAYQGTFAAPVFIAGLHMNVYTTAIGDPTNTTDADWDGVLTGIYLQSATSGKPSSLTSGTNCVWIGTNSSSSEYDNARFTCNLAGVDISNVALARAALNNKNNWTTKTNGSPVGFTLPTTCAYATLNTDSFDSFRSFTLYPNPARGTIKIESSLAGDYKLVNQLGQVIKRFRVEEAIVNEIDLANLNAGVYFVLGPDGSNANTQKLIIQ